MTGGELLIGGLLLGGGLIIMICYYLFTHYWNRPDQAISPEKQEEAKIFFPDDSDEGYEEKDD